MLKKHLENTLTYFHHSITNAMSKGFNSRIQSIKSQARGFRAFANYCTRIIFYCGKLKLRGCPIPRRGRCFAIAGRFQRPSCHLHRQCTYSRHSYAELAEVRLVELVAVQILLAGT